MGVVFVEAESFFEDVEVFVGLGGSGGVVFFVEVGG